jgi:hypothetical protein
MLIKERDQQGMQASACNKAPGKSRTRWAAPLSTAAHNDWIVMLPYQVQHTLQPVLLRLLLLVSTCFVQLSHLPSTACGLKNVAP